MERLETEKLKATIGKLILYQGVTYEILGTGFYIGKNSGENKWHFLIKNHFGWEFSKEHVKEECWRDLKFSNEIKYGDGVWWVEQEDVQIVNNYCFRNKKEITLFIEREIGLDFI